MRKLPCAPPQEQQCVPAFTSWGAVGLDTPLQAESPVLSLPPIRPPLPNLMIEGEDARLLPATSRVTAGWSICAASAICLPRRLQHKLYQDVQDACDELPCIPPNGRRRGSQTSSCHQLSQRGLEHLRRQRQRLSADSQVRCLQRLRQAAPSPGPASNNLKFTCHQQNSCSCRHDDAFPPISAVLRRFQIF